MLQSSMLQSSMLQLSLWRTWLLKLYTERTKVTQFLNGLWSAAWGLFVAGGTAQHAAPHVFGWMQPCPAWAWGLLWLAKGLWQVWAVLAFWRARLLGDDAGRQRALMHSYWAALANVVTAFSLACGFGGALGLWNVWSAYHLGLCLVSIWCFWRIAGERKNAL